MNQGSDKQGMDLVKLYGCFKRLQLEVEHLKYENEHMRKMQSDKDIQSPPPAYVDVVRSSHPDPMTTYPSHPDPMTTYPSHPHPVYEQPMDDPKIMPHFGGYAMTHILGYSISTKNAYMLFNSFTPLEIQVLLNIEPMKWSWVNNPRWLDDSILRTKYLNPSRMQMLYESRVNELLSGVYKITNSHPYIEFIFKRSGLRMRYQTFADEFRTRMSGLMNQSIKSYEEFETQYQTKMDNVISMMMFQNEKN
jgi:hypothetical protein